MQSCIYEGQVRHARARPVSHRFRYRVFMMYLDLAELDTVFRRRWFWSTGRPALARFRRSDYLGPPEQSLDKSVRDLVERETGSRPRGPIRLLTNLRYFGYSFNPVSYYYCFDEQGEHIEAYVAEVTNTPWGERDTYVLEARRGRGRGDTQWFRDRKKMHVSPFMPMDMDYDFCFEAPGDRLSLFMASSQENRRLFSASLMLSRTEISAAALARVLFSYPLMTTKVIVAIHWQALKLWLKGVPVHAHPKKRGKVAMQSQ